MTTPRPQSDLIDAGLEWTGPVPRDWPIRRLGHFFSERRQKVSDKDFAALSVTMKGVVPQLENVAKTDDGDNRKRVCAGDFVINSRSDRKGSGGVAPLDGSVSLINIVLQPIGGLHIRFAGYLLTSYPFQEEFYRVGNGIVADMWTTKYSEMKNIRVAAPTEKAQESITAFLDRATTRIDALIIKKTHFIELLREKRQAMIALAVTNGLNASVPMKDSRVEWLGKIPTSWSTKRLRFVCDVTTGSKDTVDATPGGKYPFYVRSQEVERIDSFSADCEAVLTAGDGAGVGKIYHYVTGKFDFHQRVYMMYNFRGVRGKFFYYYLSSLFAAVALDGGAKSTVDSLRMPVFKNFSITMPGLSEQDEIVAFIEKRSLRIDAMVANTERSIELLREHRIALITAAVTGKIDLREAA